MNKRLKELMLESGYVAPELAGRANKLAELLIRECVKVMYDNAIERNVPPNIDKTPTKYAIAILEYFGVEDIDTQLRNRSTYFGNNP